MKTDRVRNDDLLLRMVRIKMGDIAYREGANKRWLVAMIRSWGQGLEDEDVDDAIRDGILVDSGKERWGERLFRPAE